MSLGPSRFDAATILAIVSSADHAAALAAHGPPTNCAWDDLVLKAVKDALRTALRTMQETRCAYCRRRLIQERRNVYEDIEHFLDKSKAHYRQWAFVANNLVLACHACNIQKTTKDLGEDHVKTSNTYPNNQASFKWIHPYLSDYHDSIEISKGWLYAVKDNAPEPVRAKALIDELKLDEVERIEAYATSIRNRIYELTKEAGEALIRNDIEEVKRLNALTLQFLKESTFG